MKLWSGVLSPFSAKVRIALAEKTVECELHEVPWSRKRLWGPKPPEFLAVSPYGKVPVLVDGDLSIHDSTVINEYLEERYPAPGLLPGDLSERARCRSLEDEADTTMVEHVTALVQEVFTKTDDATRDTARIAAGRAGVLAFYGRLENALDGREFLCGAFSLADISAFMVIGFASTLGVPPSEAQPRLRAWTELVGSRPSVASEFEAMTKAAALA